jgi:predicted nucleic acid-binding protein
MPDLDWSADTNILLRFFQPDKPEYEDIHRATSLLWASGAKLFYTSQMLSEFWNVCTRPVAANGFGLSIPETNECLLLLESKLYLAPDSEQAHKEWRKIVVDQEISGIQVHDARIVATLRVNRIPHLLTLNARDFRRYPGLAVERPGEVVARLSQ